MKYKIRHRQTRQTQIVTEVEYREGAFHNWDVIETIQVEEAPKKVQPVKAEGTKE